MYFNDVVGKLVSLKNLLCLCPTVTIDPKQKLPPWRSGPSGTWSKPAWAVGDLSDLGSGLLGSTAAYRCATETPDCTGDAKDL